jgi:hypothetical protein
MQDEMGRLLPFPRHQRLVMRVTASRQFPSPRDGRRCTPKVSRAFTVRRYVIRQTESVGRAIAFRTTFLCGEADGAHPSIAPDHPAA